MPRTFWHEAELADRPEVGQDEHEILGRLVEIGVVAPEVRARADELGLA